MSRYTPGHSTTSVDFMRRRTLDSHGAFFQQELQPGLAVLDLGCGPGTITLEIAEVVAPGHVTGVDLSEDQLRDAREQAIERGLTNVEFRQGTCDELPLPDRSVDRVFCHALLEHVSEPIAALAEARRVLRPGGRIGVCSPDWRGFLLAPPSHALDAAITTYTDLQQHNGGDPFIGRSLGQLLSSAGFDGVLTEARYETYPDSSVIAEYLAEQLESSDKRSAAYALRRWARHPTAMFAQAWVAATASKPYA